MVHGTSGGDSSRSDDGRGTMVAWQADGYVRIEWVMCESDCGGRCCTGVMVALLQWCWDSDARVHEIAKGGSRSGGCGLVGDGGGSSADVWSSMSHIIHRYVAV